MTNKFDVRPEEPSSERPFPVVDRRAARRVTVEAEEAVRESEARLSAMLEAMPDCIQIFAEDGRLVYINSRGLEFLQAPNLEALSTSDNMPVLPQCFERCKSERCRGVHKKAITGEAVNWTCDIIGIQGRRSHVEVNSVPFRLPDGSKAHMVISRDISERQKTESILRRKEEHLRLVQEATGLADFESGPDGTALFSSQFVEQVGLPPGTASLTFADWLEIIHPDDRDCFNIGIEECLSERDVFQAEFRIVRPDTGEVRWLSSRTKMLRDEDGNVKRVIGAHLDITERKRSEEALRESEERFRLAVGAAHLGVWAYDSRTDTREWSDRMLEIWGFSPNVKPSLELAAEHVHADDRSKFLELLHEIRDGNSMNRFEFSFRIVRANDGAEHWIAMNGWKADRSEGANRIILTIRDITDEKTVEERIRWSAKHDTLTQLANRGNFQEQLDRAVQSAKKKGSCVGLLMIDLDHFKQVNDSLGHAAGDRLLQAFAERLRASVRSCDEIARLGGDEFAILVPDLPFEQRLAELCSSIHERLREPFIEKGRVLDCRISIGAAIYPQHGTTPKEMLIRADMALFSAKRAGRSTTIVYNSALGTEEKRDTLMVKKARAAIQENRIVPYYQPKLDLAKGSIVGFEALLRWRDSRAHVHLPATIEAAFEDHEVAAAISDRMIELTIADMRTWLDDGVCFGHVAVNASAAEFRRDDFAERVLESLQKAEIPLECFQLEVTEMVFLGRGAEYVQRALTLLSSMGVQIALDDFGTGYASLRHLKDFPVDILKIDKSFVRNMENDLDDDAIIRAVVNLGKNLNIKVVAEGIEKMNQAERLIELGCDYGQGFLFSKAVPASRVPALVAHLPEQSQRVCRPSSKQRLKLVSSQN